MSEGKAAKAAKEKLDAIREKLNSLRPTMPTLYGVFHNARSVNIFPPIDVKFNADCFVETANVNMVARWKNVSAEYVHCVFMIPMRGSVTDCFIHIGNERLRTVGLKEKLSMVPNQSYAMEDEEKSADVTIKINSNTNEEKIDDTEIKEWELSKEIFAYQIPGYFRIAFDRVKPQQVFRVDMYYIETLKIQQMAFTLKLPITFDKSTIPRKKWNQVLKINTTVHHPTDVNLTAASSTHKLSITKMDRRATITPIQVKHIEYQDKNNINPDQQAKVESLETFGQDFILQYYFVSDTFSGALYTNNDDYDGDDNKEDTISHHILITPPSKPETFAKSVCFFIERSAALNNVWIDIVDAVGHSLNKLQDNELFSVVVFPSPSGDRQAFAWNEGSEFQRPTKDNIDSAKQWLTTYGPEKRSASLERPLYEALRILNEKSQGFQVLVLIGASQYQDQQNERDIISKMNQFQANNNLLDEQRIMKQRIFTVSIGDGVNRYLMKHLSNISRGKNIHITNPATVQEELVSFFNEFRHPLCRDLKLNVEFFDDKLEFNQEEMLHPYPITDLYTNHCVVLKLSVPNVSGYKIKQATITAFCADGQSEITIAVIEQDNYNSNNKQESFPMEILLAQSHLDALHSQIWIMDGLNENALLQILKLKANQISDTVGLTSPTRDLQTSEEIYVQQEEEKKKDLSSLSLPPRTGRGGRRKKGAKGKKNKAAAIGAVAGVGAIATVVVVNPFGGDASMFGGFGDVMEDACCDQCTGDGCCDQCTDACDACCNSGDGDSCIIL